MVSYGEITPDPPPKKKKKIKKNKFVLKYILGHFQYFEPMFFLGENMPIRPSPLLVEDSTNFFETFHYSTQYFQKRSYLSL